ncbi:hypothetical protein QR680_013327 [Steinernema hermaphroditum]|uniref:Uncharacterized protein n=1 Tax=Steinernema hermaphroditum TaxID=289476 RepID=A0AA39I7S3_9BILA|nr:hypothetical protein QR680_013327 [Steinernema hermaphroditum]
MSSRALLFLCCAFFAVAVDGDVGTCRHQNPPPSWLTTTGHGLEGWATAGVPPTGPNFCLQGSENKTRLEVDYHINLSRSVVLEQRRLNVSFVNQNACHNKDPRITYCVPFCAMPSLQAVASLKALTSSDPKEVAEAIHAELDKAKDWVVTVIKVNFRAVPQAHLDVQSFPDPSWCSVYIGIDTASDSYLFEIQIARILLS